MKTYILLKDLPNAKIGTELNLGHPGCPENWYAFIDDREQLVKFSTYDVENMPDWFMLKQEKVWTDYDMIEFAYEISGISKVNVETGLEEFKVMKHKNVI